MKFREIETAIAVLLELKFYNNAEVCETIDLLVQQLEAMEAVYPPLPSPQAMPTTGFRQLRITQCSDSALWYKDLVGSVVPLLAVESDCYLSREPSGYTNIVKLEDGVIEEISG